MTDFTRTTNLLARIALTASVVLSLLCCRTGYAAPGDLIFPIHNPTPDTDDYFARTLALTPNGNIFTGSFGDKIAGVNAGSAYVFDRTNGQMILHIPNPSPDAGDSFGAFLWSTTSQLAVGAWGDDANGLDNGRAYVFHPTTGQLVHTLNSPTASTTSRFGWSINAVGEDVLVGSREDDTIVENAGAAFLFSGATGQLLKSFYPPSPGIADLFGFAVLGVGTKVVIGAPTADIGATDAGAAYVFDSVSGNLLFTIPNPEPSINANFGFMARAYGSDFLIGTAGTGAWLVNGATGQVIRKFSNPEPAAGGRFGGALGNNGSDIFVSNLDVRDPSGALGAVYVFNSATGAYKRKMISPQVITGLPEQHFGATLIGLGTNVLVTAHFETDQGFIHSGNVYLMDSSNPAAGADSQWLNME